jgi:uncharacterized protein DUF742
MNSERFGSAAAGARGGSEDAWYDDNAGPLVRLYAMTEGRSRPDGDEFAVSTLIVCTSSHAAGTELSSEKAAILRLCTRAVSVAEIAAHLVLPLGTVTVLLGDLRSAGLIQTPQPANGRPAAEVLERLRDGLQVL